MFYIFRKNTNCKNFSRTWRWQIAKCGKCQCKSTREVLDINEIAYEKIPEKLKEGAILIDVRTKQEFLEGHLQGAILIPYYDIFRKVENIIPNKNQTIIVYCKNGGRSVRAWEILKSLGYKKIYNLKDGMEGKN